MSIEPLASLDRSTLRERALESVRSAIIAGQYRPGDHLSEVELANSLGVSRGTVREALRHHQQEGLVTAGNRGMLRVSTLSHTEVRELVQVRAALEGMAVREIIASPRREAAVVSLRAALDHLSDEGEDFRARIEADLAFHLQLCRQAGNSMLVEAWQHLEGRMKVAILNGAAWQAPMMARDRHAPIVDAIEQGDVTAALRVVDEHMASAAERFAEAPESA